MSGRILPGPRTPALGFAAGGWYGPTMTGANSTPASTLNRCLLAPFLVPRAASFDRIGIEVTTAAATAVVRLGIYNSANGLPTTVLLDAGTVDASTTGAKEITISQTLTPGWWFLASVVQVASGVVIRCKVGPGPGIFEFAVGTASLVGGMFQSSMSGALATYTNGLSGNIGDVGKVYLRAA